VDFSGINPPRVCVGMFPPSLNASLNFDGGKNKFDEKYKREEMGALKYSCFMLVLEHIFDEFSGLYLNQCMELFLA